MIYRIITEDKGDHWTQAIEILVSKSFEGFSIKKQTGYYKGSKENSIVIEIDTIKPNIDLNVSHKIEKLASEIRDTLNQECVLIQRIASYSYLV